MFLHISLPSIKEKDKALDTAAFKIKKPINFRVFINQTIQSCKFPLSFTKVSCYFWEKYEIKHEKCVIYVASFHFVYA